VIFRNVGVISAAPCISGSINHNSSNVVIAAVVVAAAVAAAVVVVVVVVMVVVVVAVVVMVVVAVVETLSFMQIERIELNKIKCTGLEYRSTECNKIEQNRAK
jgi:hypothetical protein